MGKQAAIRKSAPFLLVFLVLTGLYLISLSNYLLFHSVAEGFSIVVAGTIFVIAWNSRQWMDNNYLLFVGIALLFTGGIDLVHMLAYRGMGIFPGYDSNLPTQLWIAARYTQAVSFLIAPLFLNRKLRVGPAFLCFALVSTLLLLSIFSWRIFPACYVEGAGLTDFKKVSEYIISAIFLASVFLLFRRRAYFEEDVFYLLVVSIFLTIGAELAFTTYLSVFGSAVAFGHTLRVAAMYLIYKALIETGLTRPYDFLFRNLRESEERFRGLFEDSHAVMLVIDPVDGTIVDANASAVAYYGWSREELLRQKISNINTLSPGQIQSEMDAAKEKQRNYFEFRHRLADGSVRDVEVFSGPVTFGGRQLLSSIVHDVTRRKQAEQAMRESEEKFRSVFMISPDAVYLATLDDGRIIEINKGYERVFGYARDEVIGKTSIQLNLYEDAADRARMISDLKEKGFVQDLELRGRRKNGDIFTGLLSVSLVTIETGQHTVGVVRDITERKQAEDALRESEARLLEAQSVGHVGNWDWNMVTNELYWSEENYRIYGLSPDIRPSVEAFLATVDQTDLDMVKKAMDDALTGKRQYDVDMKVKRLDGRACIVNARARVTFDHTGKPVRMLGTVQDITDRKMAEEALRENEEKYRSIFEKSLNAIFLLDSITGRYLDANSAAQTLAGRTVESLRKLTTEDVTPAGAGNRLQIARTITEARDVGEVEFLRPDGSKRTALMSVVPAGGNLIFGIALDITTRKERRMLEAILASMSEGLVVLDRDRRVAYFNHVAETIIGVRATDILGQSAEVLQGIVSSRSSDPGALLAAWADALTRLEELPKFENEVMTSLGKRVVEATMFLVGDRENPLGSGTILRDVTREREIDKMKSEFISIASHELRTPLTGIFGFAELLLKRAPELTEGHRKWAATVHTESARLSNIVEDLLNVSSIEAGRLSLDLGPVEAIPVIERVVEQARQAHGSHQFIVEKTVDFPMILADAEKLQQVFHNLIDNACKYSPAGGPVTVSARPESHNHRAVFSVSDKGLGIPQEEMPNLFGRFHRVKRLETTGLRGTGLGLYIVKSMVEMMGGKIWVESKVDRGSTFFFSLPLAELLQNE